MSDVQVARGLDAPDHAGWSDSSARAVLQLIVESVAEMIGFEVAVLSVVLDDALVTVAYSGPEEYREMLMPDDPVSVLDPIRAQAEAWGRFRFLAGEDYDNSELGGHWVVVSPDRGEHPDSWHPLDVLLAFLTDDDGALVGVLSVDKPASGRRPAPAHRELLERYAAQCERAVITAFERERLVTQVAHAEAARRLIRSASMPAHASLEAVLDHTHEPLVQGFGASGSWIQLLDGEPSCNGRARNRRGDQVPLRDELVDLARCLAPRLWREQRVLVVDDGLAPDLLEDPDDPLAASARTQLADLAVTSALAIPLGAGTECLGFLVLTRRAKDPRWSPVEVGSALEIGHDLGTALMTAAALERERTLVHELQQLDDYRSHLIATLSHELRTPLTVISGNLEMLGDMDHLGAEASRYHAAMTRGTGRMKRVVDDLLLLARVSDPQHPLESVPVDLSRVARSAVSLVESTAQTKGVRLELRLGGPDGPDGPGVVVPGDPTEVDRLLTNLVSNAVKYTPSGGAVTVMVSRRGQSGLVQVADTGLGISEEDQVGLFRPFFRTTNPEALREPGTGLGLAIVATIAQRHGGTVRVTSRLGEGTTFTVLLPCP